MDPIEKSLGKLSKQAHTGSRRPPLIPPIASAPLGVPVGSHWVNTTENNIGIQTPAGVVKLSPQQSGYNRYQLAQDLPQGEGGAARYDGPIHISRACRLRTMTDVQFWTKPNTGTANVATFNNCNIKQQLWRSSTNSLVEGDPYYRSCVINDNGAGQFSNNNLALHRLWDFAFTAPTNDYFYRIYVWRDFAGTVPQLAHWNLLYDILDVVI